jgi:hypothetical protein
LINSSSNVWTLISYTDPTGSEKSINENNFNIIFSKDSSLIYSLNKENLGRLTWTFESSKKFISLNGGEKFEILQLEVDKLKLKNNLGALFNFEKKTKKDDLTVSDESIFNVPLFGIGASSSIKLVSTNHCEQKNISVIVNGNNNLANTIVPGLFGNGIGIGNISNPNSISYNFTKNYSKTGLLTFYCKQKYGNNGVSLIVKINGGQIPFKEIDLDNDSGWTLIKVSVPNSGNFNFTIESFPIGPEFPGQINNLVGGVEAIDELKFWEYQ